MQTKAKRKNMEVYRPYAAGDDCPSAGCGGMLDWMLSADEHGDEGEDTTGVWCEDCGFSMDVNIQPTAKELAHPLLPPTTLAALLGIHGLIDDAVRGPARQYDPYLSNGDTNALLWHMRDKLDDISAAIRAMVDAHTPTQIHHALSLAGVVLHAKFEEETQQLAKQSAALDRRTADQAIKEKRLDEKIANKEEECAARIASMQAKMDEHTAKVDAHYKDELAKFEADFEARVDAECRRRIMGDTVITSGRRLLV